MYVLTIDRDCENANDLHSSTSSILNVSVMALAVSDENVLVMVILA